ncbi:MAG: tol-pal system protein YbgF [Bacteroidota bacterium]|nr:tol-pal system protein YbgF [Bacteroidota bacterium]
MVLFIFLSGCKTNKNTFIHRGYHNLTARFNGYYYATESIKEGEAKIVSSYKYDYDRLLPVFLVPNNETAKTTFPDFDKAIKKSSNAIQRHTIKDKKNNEITTAGKWIDNNWNVIGISHFYKREFFSGIEAFEYVIRSYKSKDRYKAFIWLARSYNEIGAPSQAEPIISLLKEDKKISKYAKKELPAVQADYYIKRGLYKEAEKALLAAIKGGGDPKKDNFVGKLTKIINGRPSKKKRARYSFILAQLYEERKDNKKAVQYYKKVVDLKPEYEILFHAKMKQARLVDVKSANLARLKRDLLNMARDVKNTEYLDVLYYTLGEIYEKENNLNEAFANYKLSVKNSIQNPKQKALSYLKLGELSFEQADYTSAGGYYDSTMITLPKDYKDYQTISKRKETLETLIGYIRTIQREDSLQRIAKMSETDRTRFIEKLIKRFEEEEERKKEELEALQAQNENPNYNATPVPNNGMPNMNTGAKGEWYFYNQTTLSFGINDFIKKWGNRKLEDNWRRSQKAITIENQNTGDNPEDSLNPAVAVTNSITPKDKKTVEYYLTDLPLADSSMAKSNKIVIDAFYNLGSTYKDELNNNKKAIGTFEELNNRYSDHKYKLATYFQLYRIFTDVKNKTQADFYKNKILNEYPNSEYAQIIKNPNYISDKNAQKGEVELFYVETYNEFALGNYNTAFEKSKESESKFGKTDYSPKFAFIKAMSIGKLKGIDSLEAALKRVQIFYPKDPVTKQAQDILEIVYNMKHPSEASGNGAIQQKDTFSLNLNSQHFVIAICPDDAAIANVFKTAVADYNENFYSNADLTISSSLFGNADQITIIKTFDNSKEALQYIENLSKDQTVFAGRIKRELFTIMAISVENLPRLYRKKQVSYYKPFYDDHYLPK